MGILNTNFIKKFITNNQIEKVDDKGESYTDYDAVKYRWSHGSTESYLWDKIQVYLVDAANKVGGEVDWNNNDSFFKKKFNPRIILDTTENAYYNFFVKHDIKIDLLHIDAGHSYDDIKRVKILLIGMDQLSL